MPFLLGVHWREWSWFPIEVMAREGGRGPPRRRWKKRRETASPTRLGVNLMLRVFHVVGGARGGGRGGGLLARRRY